ncbi:hypothetical protein ACJX0J_014513, partial [Zea mays]
FKIYDGACTKLLMKRTKAMNLGLEKISTPVIHFQQVLYFKELKGRLVRFRACLDYIAKQYLHLYQFINCFSHHS